jgi:hypothetical protein
MATPIAKFDRQDAAENRAFDGAAEAGQAARPQVERPEDIAARRRAQNRQHDIIGAHRGLHRKGERAPSGDDECNRARRKPGGEVEDRVNGGWAHRSACLVQDRGMDRGAGRRKRSLELCSINMPAAQRSAG